MWWLRVWIPHLLPRHTWDFCNTSEKFLDTPCMHSITSPQGGSLTSIEYSQSFRFEVCCLQHWQLTPIYCYCTLPHGEIIPSIATDFLYILWYCKKPRGSHQPIKHQYVHKSTLNLKVFWAMRYAPISLGYAPRIPIVGVIARLQTSPQLDPQLKPDSVGSSCMLCVRDFCSNEQQNKITYSILLSLLCCS